MIIDLGFLGKRLDAVPPGTVHPRLAISTTQRSY